MKRFGITSSLLFAACLLATLVLSGCGMGSDSYGVVGSSIAQVSPPLQGKVFGGHAPLIGSRVYILEPSTTGNPNVTGQTGKSTSLMANATDTSIGGGSGFTPILDNIVGSPGNGYYYVITDNSGSYNLTGDYTCTQNTPVYLAAIGGTPTLTAPTTLKITRAADSGTTFTYTVASNSTLSVGEYVQITGYTGTNAYFNQAGVIATKPNGTSFTVTTTYAGGTTNTTVTGGIVTPQPSFNPAAINMTALGLCPSSTAGTGFYGAISYIYSNEVSTAAMAMAMGAFGTDAFHVGVKTGGPVDTHYGGRYDLGGLSQAMNNAGLLYDITGGDSTTVQDGEGHIARSITPAGNGVPPQALMDTLGNILAACVDSGSTSATESTTCGSLFSNATSTGKLCTGGTAPPTGCPTGTTAPTDIATAAFNIAHYPAGNGNTNFVKTLYNLSSGTVPFTPNLTTNPTPNGMPVGQPNDFSVTIAFSSPEAAGSATNLISQPQAISIDGGEYIGNEYGYEGEANGQYEEGVWIANYGGQASKLFANGGAPDYTTNTAINSATTTSSRSVAIDSNTPENVWFVIPSSTLTEWSITGTEGTSYTPTGTGDAFGYPLDAVVDADSATYHLYIPQFYGNNLLKVTSAGVNLEANNVAGTASAFSTTTPCLSDDATAAFDQNGKLYTYGEGAGYVCNINTTTGAEVSGYTGYTIQADTDSTRGFGPAFIAVDASNNVWATSTTAATNSAELIEVTAAGVQHTYTGGGMTYPCSVAVDGASNIWVGNAEYWGVSEFTNAGTAISPAYVSTTYPGGYSPQYNNVYTIGTTTIFDTDGTPTNCATPAIDRAGDVWMAYQGTGGQTANAVFETLGVAAPVVTPISYATFSGNLGVRPY